MKSIKNKKNSCIFLIIIALSTQSFALERAQILPYKFDEVWRGLLISLSKYPLKKNNQENGYIETDLIKSTDAWNPPYKKIDSNLRYKLILRVYKGKSKQRPATKILIEKRAYIKNDFLGDPKQLESDGFEEASIVYRTHREVYINRVADKKFNFKN